MNTAWRFVSLFLVMGLILVACGREPEAPEAPTQPVPVAPPPAVSQTPTPPPVEPPPVEVPQPELQAAAPVAVQPAEEVAVEEPVVAPVEWDELDALALMSRRWDTLMEETPPDGQLALVQHLVDAVTEVVESDLPPGAYDSAQVELLQTDLRSAARSAAESLEESEGEEWQEGFESQLAEIQRLAREMRETLGMPEDQ